MSDFERRCTQAVDVEQQAFTARATEFSEECELLCFAPAGVAAGDWGNELVAGAVHGSECSAKQMLLCPYVLSQLSAASSCATACSCLMPYAGNSGPSAVACSAVQGEIWVLIG